MSYTRGRRYIYETASMVGDSKKRYILWIFEINLIIISAQQKFSGGVQSIAYWAMYDRRTGGKHVRDLLYETQGLSGVVSHECEIP